MGGNDEVRTVTQSFQDHTSCKGKSSQSNWPTTGAVKSQVESEVVWRPGIALGKDPDAFAAEEGCQGLDQVTRKDLDTALYRSELRHPAMNLFDFSFARP